MRTRGRIALGLGVALSLVLAASASAAVTVGQTFVPNQAALAPTTALQAIAPNNEYTVPSPGVLTSWSFMTGATAPTALKFKAARPVGGSDFTILGESGNHVPGPGLNTFTDIRIPVRAGDVIGFFVSATGPAAMTPSPSYTLATAPGDVAPNSTTTYSFMSVNVQLDVSATLEPDCDNDGLGDETQDNEIRACPPGPAVSFTARPKDKIKTRKKTAKATFDWSANEANSTFTCTLDGQQEFKSCIPPVSVSVKKGEHTFSVTATDIGGNTGTPATDTFKVKRKKKKKK